MERLEYYVPDDFRTCWSSLRILQASVCIAYGPILIFRGKNLDSFMISVDSLKAVL